jgi:hypothetical protein
MEDQRGRGVNGLGGEIDKDVRGTGVLLLVMATAKSI